MVWRSSLAGEEPISRKVAFLRCALLVIVLPDGKWLVMEEQVKGAACEPAAGAHIAEKKGFFSKRGRLTTVEIQYRERAFDAQWVSNPNLDASSRTTIGMPATDASDGCEIVQEKSRTATCDEWRATRQGRDARVIDEQCAHFAADDQGRSVTSPSIGKSM